MIFKIFSIRSKSILFVNPDYHCSFFLRDEFRNLGWNADVSVKNNFPENLLWQKDGITVPLKYEGKLIYFLKLLFKYKYFICYGEANAFLLASQIPIIHKFLFRFLGNWELVIFKLFGCKLIYFPNGCRQEVYSSDFEKHNEGKVCTNCVFYKKECNDTDGKIHFFNANKYFSLVIDNTPMPSNRLIKAPLRYKSLDLSIFSPDISIPSKFRLAKTKKIRILHSFSRRVRSTNGDTVKGSLSIINAVEKLKKEGFDIEFMYTENTTPSEMRFLQIQADIIVDQLLYGWWGSTSIESMALGKPTVCFLWPEWKEIFFQTYPEYQSLPIIEANPQNFYFVLRKLLEDPSLRKRKGKESRDFALMHFDVKKNAPNLIQKLQSL